MPDFTEAVDVVVVGSGPAGATYARTIMDARPETTVLLIEAGPIVAEPPGLHMANITDPHERELAQVACQGPNQYRYELAATSGTAHNAVSGERERALVTRPGLFPVGAGDINGDGFPAAQESSNVGGMGSHWFGACPRPGDLERINFIDPGLLEEAYLTAERLLRVSTTEFRGCSFAAHIERVLGDALNEGRAQGRRVRPMPMAVTLTPHGVQRCGTNVILGDLLEGRNANFELRPQTLGEKIIMTDGRATGVQIRDRVSGAVSRVRARQVVAACDSLRTPQLLFASGIRPRALGHYLNEHPQVSIMAEVHGLGTDVAHDREAGNATAMSDSRAVAVASSGVTWIPYDGARFPFHGMLAQIDPDTVPRSADDRQGRNPLVSVHFFASQEVRFENWLEFSETETDWVGMPSMTIHHRLSERDRQTLERGQAEVLRLSRILGKPLDGEVPWILPSGSSLHYQGTARMGPADDGTSVSDPACRVWGVDNLHVAGNGVIPGPTACNPTLTSVALSSIGARDIVRQLDGAGTARTPRVAAAAGGGHVSP